jgi:LysM repeat protein
MRTSKSFLFLTALIVAACVPATASAAFQHVVAPGESLTSVAAADGLTVSQLAAANGISSASQLISGTLLSIPPQDAGSIAPVTTTEASSSGEVAAPASSGGYLVQPGDTLSGIAARFGVGVQELAAANGLDPAGLLLSGSSLSLSGAGTAASTSSTSSTEMVSTSVSTGGAQPTPERVSSSEVGSIAAANGVSPSLAEAIGYQESGFNNDEVSSTGATGVMQIEPGTWNYIGSELATPPPLSTASASDNIRAGSILLHSLLDQTGGDPAMAAAGYYQGLQSVRQHGLFSDTQQYVNNVMSLRQRFGGP